MKTTRRFALTVLGAAAIATAQASAVAPAAAEARFPAVAADDEPIEVSIEKLKAAKYKKGKPLEDWVSDLDGKTISIEGYMALGTIEGVNTFEFVPESCECGRSKVNHFISVTITDDVTKYRPGRFTLVGTFSASEVEEDGFVTSVYRLEIKKLD